VVLRRHGTTPAALAPFEPLNPARDGAAQVSDTAGLSTRVAGGCNLLLTVRGLCAPLGQTAL
jgi:hypothetical protein